MNQILSRGINSERVTTDILRYLRQLMLCHFFDGDVSSLGISAEEHSRYKMQMPKANPNIITKMQNLLIDIKRAFTLNMDTPALMENFIVNSAIIVAKNSDKKSS
jgi:DNA polymerase III gamma/tau subunit